MMRRTIGLLLLALAATGWFAVSSGCSKSKASPRLEFSSRNAAYMTIRREFIYGTAGAAEANPLEDPNREPQWASIRGTVRFGGGSIPSPARISITAKDAVCGTSIPDERVEVNSTGGLKNTLIFLDTPLPKLDADEDQPVWVHPSYSFKQHPELKVTEFDQKNCVFLSHVFAMRSDQTLKILNSDPVQHNTSIPGKKARSINPIIAANGSAEYNPGGQENSPISVTCSIHPFMQAYLIPRDNPYFAVSDDDGNIQIDNVPAGVELEYRIWHQQAEYLNSDELTMTLNGEAIDVKKGRFKLQLEPDETYDLAMEISASAFQ